MVAFQFMPPPPLNKVRVQRERDFSAHHLLIGTAKMALESAEAEESGWLYHELIAITFSALALEAIANSFGEKLFAGWRNDNESETPSEKITLISEKLGISTGNINEDPWAAVPWLTTFRNRVAHAKPESVKYDKVMLKSEFDRMRLSFPKSTLERDINTPNARRAVKCVEGILHLWCQKIPNNDLGSMLSDGFSGVVSHHDDPSQ